MTTEPTDTITRDARRLAYEYYRAETEYNTACKRLKDVSDECVAAENKKQRLREVLDGAKAAFVGLLNPT